MMSTVMLVDAFRWNDDAIYIDYRTDGGIFKRRLLAKANVY